MKEPGFTDIFGRLLEEVRDGYSPQPYLGYSDTRFYTDSNWFDKERTALFKDKPILVGHLSMLPKSGDVFTHDHLGTPMMVVKGKDNTVRAFLNVCRHRGVRLVNTDETSNQTSFVCPYHNWVYDLQGDLTHIPLKEESFPTLDPNCHNLRELPLGICEGLIFVCPDPEGSLDMEQHMGMIKSDYATFKMADHVFFRQSTRRLKTNWKLLVEAFQDGYHIKRLHRNTVAPGFLDAVARSERSGDHLLAVIARNEFFEALDLPAEQWDLRRHASCAMYLFPNVEVIVHPDYISYLAFFPTAVDETVVVHACFIEEEPKDEKAVAHWERAFDIIENGVFGPEDYFVCEQAQIGMSSGANTHLTMGAHESGVADFHKILADHMGAFDHQEPAHLKSVAAAGNRSTKL
jgi:Rieske 2Fe-2S family protein